MDDSDGTPISQRPTLPEIPTAPPPPMETAPAPKSRPSPTVMEAAWLMVERLFGKEAV